MGRQVEVGDCGCKQVTFTNKKRPGILTVIGYPCKTHGNIDNITDLADLIDLPITTSEPKREEGAA